MEKAKLFEPSNLKNPDDFMVVINQFVRAKGALSLPDLGKSIDQYNKLITQKYPKQEEKVISADKLQLEFSSISILLSELAQIQLQIATNESGYLGELSE